MAKNSVPVYKIGQHCLDEEIHEYFKITDFNTQTCTAAEFEGNHRHEYYELVRLRKGAGQVYSRITLPHPKVVTLNKRKPARRAGFLFYGRNAGPYFLPLAKF